MTSSVLDHVYSIVLELKKNLKPSLVLFIIQPLPVSPVEDLDSYEKNVSSTKNECGCFNPIALRTAKTLRNFGRFECNRVIKLLQALSNF